MIASSALLGAAAACFAAGLALGAAVQYGALARLDGASARLRGRGMGLARVFTRSGYWQALAVLNVVVFAVLLLDGSSPLPAFALGVVQLLSQGVVAAVKAIFGRPRPEDWLFHQEFGHSFPSGHATTAVVFYGGLLLLISTLPWSPTARAVLAIVPAVWMLGIPWSRIALAAHYGSDVLGGALFGAAWWCVLAVLLRYLPLAHQAG